MLVKTNSEREYSGTFTAKESGGIVPLIFEFSDSKDGVPMFFYCEDLLITPIDNSVKGIYVNDGGAWKNVDYVNDVSQTQSETGGTEIAEINNTNGTKTKIYQKTVEANPTGTATETLSSMNIGGTLYELGGGNVDDVKVDNVSVVTNKIANINTMTGADGTNAGEKGLVPAPTATDNEKYLRGDGTWQTVSGGGSAEMLAPTPFIYSETEEQVGIWIDGKPLYAKTKSFTNVSKSGSLSFGVANAETVFIKDIGKTSDSIPMPYVHGSAPSNNIGGFLTKTSSDVTWEFRSGNDAPSTLSGFMTLLYTKTTDTAWQGGFKAYGFTPVIYSEEEREIGVGENGKPLYQKTLNSGVISADSIVSTGLTNIESCHVIASETIENKGSVEFSPFVISMYNYQGSGTEYGFIYFDVSNHEIKYVNQSRSTTVKIRAVVQYTKTTDTAGSGKYTTLGTPAVHYSTDEQVIGTWIDGKTLYQKTVTTGGNVPSGATLIQRISQTGYDTIQYTKTS